MGDENIQRVPMTGTCNYSTSWTRYPFPYERDDVYIPPHRRSTFCKKCEHHKYVAQGPIDRGVFPKIEKLTSYRGFDESFRTHYKTAKSRALALNDSTLARHKVDGTCPLSRAGRATFRRLDDLLKVEPERKLKFKGRRSPAAIQRRFDRRKAKRAKEVRLELDTQGFRKVQTIEVRKYNHYEMARKRILFLKTFGYFPRIKLPLFEEWCNFPIFIGLKYKTGFKPKIPISKPVYNALKRIYLQVEVGQS